MSAHPIFEHLFANLGLMARKEARHEAENGMFVEDVEADVPPYFSDEDKDEYMRGIPYPNPVRQDGPED